MDRSPSWPGRRTESTACFRTITTWESVVWAGSGKLTEIPRQWVDRCLWPNENSLTDKQKKREYRADSVPGVIQQSLTMSQRRRGCGGNKNLWIPERELRNTASHLHDKEIKQQDSKPENFALKKTPDRGRISTYIQDHNSLTLLPDKRLIRSHYPAPRRFSGRRLLPGSIFYLFPATT